MECLEIQWYGGAGGGGWFGGAGVYPPSGSTVELMGGGGGSGYVFTSTTVPNPVNIGGTWLLDARYYLTNASTVSGTVVNGTATYDGLGMMTGNTGNGLVKITWVDE